MGPCGPRQNSRDNTSIGIELYLSPVSVISRTRMKQLLQGKGNYAKVKGITPRQRELREVPLRNNSDSDTLALKH